MQGQLRAAVSVLLLILLAALAVAMKTFCKFKTPPDPMLPFSKKSRFGS
jgi:hypothetical protein